MDTQMRLQQQQQKKIDQEERIIDAADTFGLVKKMEGIVIKQKTYSKIYDERSQLELANILRQIVNEIIYTKLSRQQQKTVTGDQTFKNSAEINKNIDEEVNKDSKEINLDILNLEKAIIKLQQINLPYINYKAISPLYYMNYLNYIISNIKRLEVKKQLEIVLRACQNQLTAKFEFGCKDYAKIQKQCQGLSVISKQNYQKFQSKYI